MASIKAGSTVGGVAILTSLAIPNMSGAGTGAVGDYLGTDGTGDRLWLTHPYVKPFGYGTQTAYYVGGVTVDKIESFPFAAPPTPFTDEGNLSATQGNNYAYSSSTDGYSSAILPSPAAVVNVDTFPFTGPFVTASSIGSLTQLRNRQTGASGPTTGITMGGYSPGSPSVFYNTIDTFPWTTSPMTATDVGNLTGIRGIGCGISSGEAAFMSGGSTGPTYVDIVDELPFAGIPGNATDVGNLSQARYGASGHGSETDGYSSGGFIPSPAGSINTIDRFPFSTPFTTATDVGNSGHPNGGYLGAGSSSGTEGFHYGERGFPTPSPNNAYKFPFAAPFVTASSLGAMPSPHADQGSGAYY